MWLILAAAGVDGIGPDTSAASANLMTVEALKAAVTGRTVRYAEASPGGPYLMRLDADGTATLRKGAARQLAFTGKWWIDGNRLCRGWDKFQPNFDCWPVSIEGTIISLFGDKDTMFLQGTLISES